MADIVAKLFTLQRAIPVPFLTFCYITLCRYKYEQFLRKPVMFDTSFLYCTAFIRPTYINAMFYRNPLIAAEWCGWSDWQTTSSLCVHVTHFVPSWFLKTDTALYSQKSLPSFLCISWYTVCMRSVVQRTEWAEKKKKKNKKKYSWSPDSSNFVSGSQEKLVCDSLFHIRLCSCARRTTENCNNTPEG